jgi:hypothetical protein
MLTAIAGSLARMGRDGKLLDQLPEQITADHVTSFVAARA